MGHAATSAVISTAEPGTEGGVEEEVFQSKELMSMVVSLSDMSITDLSRFALVCRRWRDVARDPLFPFRLSQALCVGTIEKDVRPEFVWLSTLRSERVVSASAGGSHCLFLTSSGRVYGMGTNAQGRLGLNHSVHACRSPEFVSSLEHQHIVKVEAGFLCSFALTKEGKVFAFGSNTNGELGLGTNTSPVTPVIVDALNDEEIVDVSSDMHTLFLTRAGRIYSCGLGRFGQLGHGDEACLMTPKPIAAFETTRIRMICAGGSHSFAVSEHDEQLYAWGRNEHGELGRKDKSNQSLPTPLKVGQGEPIDSITTGTWHSLVLTKEGRCYTFGTGRASLGSKDTAWQPTIVPGLEDQKVIAMAGGDDHSLFVTEDGVYAMGNTKRSRIGRHNGDALTRAERLGGGLGNKGRPFAVTAGDNFSVVLL